MKLVLAALILATPVLVVAQSAPAAITTADKPVAASAAKPAAKSKPVTTKAAAPSKAAVRRSALKAVEEVTPVDDDPNFKLSALDLETAGRVHVGLIPCELGAAVTVTADDRRPGFFTVQTKGNRFRMHPVESRTGAIRLEDAKAGALWLQLGNKSMLMSQKLGQRLADECMSPAQLTMADEIKKNPPVSILEPLPVRPVGPAITTPQPATQN